MIRIISYILKPLKLKINKTSESDNGSDYISAKKTVYSAKSKGLSICDYVEQEWGQIGETQKVINKMNDLGAFENKNLAICEIGAGTGRYMEKVLEEYNPSRYESYETAPDWSNWLEKQYPIMSLPADGHSLKFTANNSIDLVHAHGVFVYIPFLNTIRYFIEIDRITKKGAYIVFDCITEDCLDDELLNKWLNSEDCYPRPIFEDYILRYFNSEKFVLLGTFYTKYGQGKSKYFVFKKLM